jgi:phosphate transport system permease protein
MSADGPGGGWLRAVVTRVAAIGRALVTWFLAAPVRFARWLRALPGRLGRWLIGLPRRTARWIRASPAAIRRVALGTWRTLVGSDPTVLEAGYSLALLASLASVVVAFLTATSVTAYPLVAAVLLVGVGWARFQARTAKLLTLVATTATVVTLGFITVFLFEQAWGPIEEFGAGLLAIPLHEETGNLRWFFWLDAVLPTSDIPKGWDPNNARYSLLAAAWATVLVTIIAGLVSGPLGILGALFIAEIASARVREVIKPAVEILAGIPSIVYGFIGFAVLNSFMQDAFLDAGASFLIAGLVVGVMALPTTVSVAEDALSAVPDRMSDGAIALGATDWQTMKSISVPAAFSGISAGVILGLGRAIGETMAVAAIMASGTTFARPLYDVFDQSVTLTSRIATTYGSASELTVEVLFVAGVMLFAIVSLMSLLAQYVERRMERKLGGEL